MLARGILDFLRFHIKNNDGRWSPDWTFHRNHLTEDMISILTYHILRIVELNRNIVSLWKLEPMLIVVLKPPGLVFPTGLGFPQGSGRVCRL